MIFGPIADRIGRVRALTLSILLYSLATAGLATSGALWQLVMWRVLVGVGMGGEWSCGSVLVAETWPAEHRGKAMGLMQSGWAIGALIAALPAPRRRVVSRDTVFRTAPVLPGSGPARAQDLARDGRFLGLVTNRNDYELVVVPNWLPELKKRLAGGR